MPCPWSSWTPAAADFCEASLCAWIRQPANTWSNIGFIIGGVVLFWMTSREGWRHMRLLAYASVATGIGSAFFHASETWVSVAGDYLGMYMGSAFMLACCLRRWTGASQTVGQVFFWTYTAVTMGILLYDHTQARMVYMAGGLVCMVSDTGLLIRDRKKMVFRWYLVLWVLFIVAGVLWAKDGNGSWCNPDNHVINGHAAWHLINAAALVVLALYYEQFHSLKIDS